jgi:hypothetical protein
MSLSYIKEKLAIFKKNKNENGQQRIGSVNDFKLKEEEPKPYSRKRMIKVYV